MSLQAYQRVSQRSESPRQVEYRLFGEVTRALIDAAALPVDDLSGRMAALDWNRRLWSTLGADCARDDNGLPPSLRARIISISLWVGRHTSETIRGQASFDDLIDINRIMMQGLAGQVEAAA